MLDFREHPLRAKVTLESFRKIHAHRNTIEVETAAIIEITSLDTKTAQRKDYVETRLANATFT